MGHLEVYLGLDWSESHHDVCVLNPAGAALARLTIPHSPRGFAQLDTVREQLGVERSACLIALETAHNLIIDDLWDRGYGQVYVVPPSVVASVRGRYGQNRARTDQSDSFLLADLLRTDRARLQPWHPDTRLTRQLRARVREQRFLTHTRVRLSNRLRAVLLRYHPALVGVFGKLWAPLSLALIQAYPTPQAVAQLDYATFARFAQAHHYCRPQALQRAFARLKAPVPQPSADTLAVYQGEALRLAQLLGQVTEQQHTQLRQLQALFRQHPDYAIFDSLPGAGAWLAPALLAQLGDERARFASAASLQALAGTCPVTEHSGKRHVVRFRRGCNREFRHIAQQWAKQSRRQSAWAQAYYQQVRPRCASDNHALRCLANRWLAVLWTLWQTRQPYDEAYHLRQRAQRSQPRR